MIERAWRRGAAGALIALIVTAGSIACRAPDPPPEPSTVVVLVRHAEKASDPQDPPLAERGRERARELARVFADADVGGVYASQFLRTRQTLEPLAALRGLDITVVPVEGRDLQGYARSFARSLLRDHRGGTVVVAGHSNTVPPLIEALGVASAPVLSEDDYDDLFVVEIPHRGPARLLHLHYGAAPDH